MSNYKAPCKNCPDRKAGCHGKCEKYQAFRAGQEKIYAARDKVHHDTDPVAGYLRTRKIKRLHAESRKAK